MPPNTIGGKDATKFEVAGHNYLPRFTANTRLQRNEEGEILLHVEAFVLSGEDPAGCQWADTLRDAVRGAFATVPVLYDLWGESASFTGKVRDWKLIMDEDNTIKESFVLKI